ncbi:MAG: Uma2 family endonuclease [Chloroflexi bacterium]|jgi:Uma2 family endonuclease|uniref:Uma2 family endonuclease n=1 Tax=Candidatus Thermofonsia Clade 3 bacterium TaxID=2364212 RepID=A0A2M8QAG0_9CHLR|nr:Uma2 family endonuclease [Candidatus Roseilinea sp. NK_OTU-006]PJF46788.1 MAG: Uma2 family endonuclease [Candidatus Thermofonsia Clade 3 bacterium]RMG65155.1 MAG: Uma2 family endonuclease [Chloroflexota bacterium]
MTATERSSDDLLYAVLRSPRLVQLRDRIAATLEEEQVRREQFYETVREDQKAEFINGEVIVHSPAQFHHTRTVTHLIRLLSAFVEARGMGITGTEKMMISLSRNDYEPDICYFAEAKARLFTGDQTRFPAPDLIVEVLSPSTEQIDRTIKFEDYAAHGVTEYWLVEPETETVEQYVLSQGRYELAMKSRTGTLASIAIPGFEIPVRAIFDKAENLKALRSILS